MSLLLYSSSTTGTSLKVLISVDMAASVPMFKLKMGIFGRNEKGTDRDCNLSFTGTHRPHKEGSGEQAVNAVDITTESTHNGKEDSPFTIVVNLVDIVHQRGPSLEGTSFFCRNFLIDKLGNKLVLVGLTSGSSVYSRECRQIVVLFCCG